MAFAAEPGAAGHACRCVFAGPQSIAQPLRLRIFDVGSDLLTPARLSMLSVGSTDPCGHMWYAVAVCGHTCKNGSHCQSWPFMRNRSQVVFRMFAQVVFCVPCRALVAMPYDLRKHLGAMFKFVSTRHDLSPITGISVASLCAGMDTVQIVLDGLMAVSRQLKNLMVLEAVEYCGIQVQGSILRYCFQCSATIATCWYALITSFGCLTVCFVVALSALCTVVFPSFALLFNHCPQRGRLGGRVLWRTCLLHWFLRSLTAVSESSCCNGMGGVCLTHRCSET